MKIISLVSIKGGVGKSATSIAIAQILSEHHKVLLIVSDPQNATTSHFIENLEDIENKTLRQVLNREIVLLDSIININNKLDVLAGEIELCLIEKELAGISNQFFLLYDFLSEIESEYEFVVIDTTPAISLLTKMAIITSDIIIIPTQLEKWAIKAINATLLEIEDCKQAQKYIDKKIERILILPTFYEERRVVKQFFLNTLKANYLDFISQHVIHSSVEISKTCSMQKELISPGSRSYLEYKNVVNEILKEDKVVV